MSINKENDVLDVCFVVPYEYYKNTFCKDDVAVIENACKDILPKQFLIKVRFTKCLLDEDIVKKHVYNFFVKKFMSLLNQINFKNVDVKIEEGKVVIVIPLATSIFQFCKKVEMDNQLVDFLSGCFSEETKVVFEESGEFDVSDIVRKEITHVAVFSTHINICNRIKLYGSIIETKPKYISKFNKVSDEICVCGKISELKRRISKKEMVYYTFLLDDTTGQMGCVFVSKSKTKAALDGVVDGQELVIVGRLVEDTYNKGFKLIAKSMAMCKIDFESIAAQKELMAIANKNRQPVEPKPFEGEVEHHRLDEEPRVVPPIFAENVFVVFDLETTGRDPKNDKIIEIGAVKIVGGEIVDYYSTLVDPKISVPSDASDINHIYDADLVDAPYFEDIMQSFLDYCEGCFMVAHNAIFDMSFMRNACIENAVGFDNKYFDTLELSRKAKPKQNRHNL
ncbi:MAG: exonuclease domain-containing protein, partial [Clostridia bacterium]